MKNITKFILLLALSLASVFAATPSAPSDSRARKRTPVSLQTTTKMRNETRYVVFLLERGHYLKMPVGELDVREFVREYMQNVDFFKLFFTSEDVQYFQDLFAPAIEIMLSQGTLLPAFTIYDRFLERADARMQWIRERMKKPFNLDSDKTFRPDRSKEDWPSDMKAADALWEKRLVYDIVNQMLGYSDELDGESEEASDSKKGETSEPAEKSGGAEKAASETSSESAGAAKPAETPQAEVAELEAEKQSAPKTFEEKLAKAKEEVLKRYERLVENYAKADAMEIQEIYLNTLARLYDPHTAFLSEYYLEEFDISVRNSLVGIGAMLQDKDGYCTLAELMPGGPAEECKQLHTGDKILGVGQETGEIVDVIGMKLRKTVRLIRGKENTKVRLLIEPASNPSARKVITLVRREIKLTTKLAKAAVYTIPVGDKTVPVGVIDLPAFYGESGGTDGSKGFSTSKDVEELLLKLKKMGVKGVVLDLRRNGGGFLNEAVDLAGLFIKTGPVVQVRDAAGRTNRLRDENPKLVWDGPLVIMVSRLSASATEIVAGALQNHKRAIVVGDKSTHGKGTVQAVYHLENFDPQQKSAAKITVQKWYAPNGDSIQIKGVHSDIVLPSVYDYMEIGEEYKDYAMKWDAITPDSIEEVWGYGFKEPLADALMAKLTEQSLARRNSLDEFKIWNERINWVKERQKKKDWSLNYAVREKELKADEDFNESLKKRQRKFTEADYPKTEVLLDSAKENGGDKKVSADKKKRKSKNDALEASEDDEDAPDFDVQLHEALRIMGDWIDLVDHPDKLKAYAAAGKKADAANSDNTEKEAVDSEAAKPAAGESASAPAPKSDAAQSSAPQN